MKTYHIETTIEITKNNISRILLQDAKLQLNEGEMIILKANNGSGKTTFIKTLLGSVDMKSLGRDKDSSDKIRSNLTQISLYEQTDEVKTILSQSMMAQRIAYMKQSFPDHLINGRLIDFIKENMRGIIDDSKISDLFNSKIFLALIDNMIKLFFYEKDFNYQKFTKADSIKHMSGGELQSLFFIATMIRGIYSEIIILDEPFNNVGYTQKKIMCDIIRKMYEDNPSKIFLIISHCTIINLESYKFNKCYTIHPITKKFETDLYNNFSCLGDSTSDYFDYAKHINEHNISFSGITR